jgi:translation initiation factor IF-1
MANKEEKIEVEWVVVNALPGLVFDVKLSEDFWNAIVRWYVSGSMRKNYIRVIVWDVVNIELSPYDLTQGRIVFRKK